MRSRMELQNLASELKLNSVCNGACPVEVTGGYVSDLMSDVLAKAKHGDVWVTNQKHVNVIAVASLLGLSGVIIAGGMAPDENALEKAIEEKVPLFLTDRTAFEVVGRLYSLGIRPHAG